MTKPTHTEKTFVSSFLREAFISKDGRSAVSGLINMGNGTYARVFGYAGKDGGGYSLVASTIGANGTLTDNASQPEAGKGKDFTFDQMTAQLAELSKTKPTVFALVPLAASRAKKVYDYSYEVLPVIDPSAAPKQPSGMTSYPIRVRNARISYDGPQGS